MKKFTEEEIEQFYLETTQGIYLKECAKNDLNAKGFYDNQLGEFMAGFKCCHKEMVK